MQVFKAPQAQVLSALQSVAGVVERRQTLPILSNVLLRKKGETLELTIRQDADAPTRKKTIDAWYRAELYEMAGAMLPAAERTVGKRAGEIKVRDMKSRWGTCNIKTAHITLNLRLAERPSECLRYVLIHELCHLHEAGHGEKFWRRMDEYYPDWKRVRKQLREKI